MLQVRRLAKANYSNRCYRDYGEVAVWKVESDTFKFVREPFRQESVLFFVFDALKSQMGTSQDIHILSKELDLQKEPLV